MKWTEIDSLRQFCSMNTVQCTMEDGLWWKTTFDRRQPSIEEDFDGRRDDGRHSLMDDNILWKMPFDERQSLMEDDL